jgi:uncharacterized protein YdaU (DUF1376 family)
MSKRIWMPMYWGDYLSDTLDLSMAHHGGYMRLIAHYWKRGSLPRQESPTDVALATDLLGFCYTIAGAQSEQDRACVRHILSSQFEWDGHTWRHDRIESELAKSRNISESRSKAGKKGAEKRHVCQSFAKELPTDPDKQMPIQSQSQSHTHTHIETLSSDGGQIETKVHQIASANPRILDAWHLPQAIETAILEAVARDGFDLVLAGTRNLADALSTWTEGELRYAPNPQKFYAQSLYLTNPVEWDRSRNGTSQPSRQDARQQRNRETIVAAAIAQRDTNAGSSGSQNREDTQPRGVAVVDGTVSQRKTGSD